MAYQKLDTVSDVAQLPLSYLDTDTALAANSDVKVASQKATKAYADGLLAANSAMIYKGVLDCSANPNYPAASVGWMWKVSVAGKVGGASGVNVEVGDTILCCTASGGGTQAAEGAKFDILQVNIDGAVIGPASVVDQRVAIFSGTTGKLLADGGKLVSDFYLASNPSGYTSNAGTVTAVSVASANGFAGSSSGGATPALTLTTSITGMLKGSASALVAATAGTDYSAGTAALATGILKSTTTTGALSIAAAGTDYAAPNQTMYIGTTSVAINRASASLALTGITSIDGTAAGLSAVLGPALGGTGVANNAANTITFTGAYSLGITLSGATALTFPTGGTVVTTSATQTLTAKTLTGVQLTAGTTGAGTAPLYFNSGTNLTVAVAGAMEFTTDSLYFTITTGTARKTIAFTDSALSGNTTGSAAKWTTARNLAGNSVDGSANVAFANAFIVQGTTDAGLTGAQFLGALTTGIVKNTTTTGVLSIAVAGTDYVAPSGTFYIGTTSIAHNRASAAMSLTGITSIDGEAAGVNTYVSTAVTSKTGNYTLVHLTDSLCLCNANAGTFTITLPTAVGYSGHQFTVKKTDASANVVGVTTTSAQTIDGLAAPRNIANPYESLTFTSDGANWFIV